MRLVKAIKKNTKEWITGYVWTGSNYACVIPYNLGVDVNNNKLHAIAYEVESDTICMNTGVDAYWVDKKGAHMTPIYEGDKLEITLDGVVCQGQVYYDMGAFVIKLVEEDDDWISFSDIKANAKNCVNAKIIGNIYDPLSEAEIKALETLSFQTTENEECPYFEQVETSYDVLSGHSDYQHYCNKKYHKPIVKCVHCTLCKQKGENK